MAAYYTKMDDKIYPIFGVNSMDEAKSLIPEENHRYIIETDEPVFMNTDTGRVGFESDWDDLSKVVEVRYSAEEEAWVAA